MIKNRKLLQTGDLLSSCMDVVNTGKKVYVDLVDTGVYSVSRKNKWLFAIGCEVDGAKYWFEFKDRASNLQLRCTICSEDNKNECDAAKNLFDLCAKRRLANAELMNQNIMHGFLRFVRRCK